MTTRKAAVATVETESKEDVVLKAGDEAKYSVDKLRQNSIHLFGVTKSTFDGAMYGHTGTEYTIKEAKAIIDTWLFGKEGRK